MLLWLRLDSGSLLYETTGGNKLADVLRFDFEATGGASATVEATTVGRAGPRTALQLDEGLLHPDIGRALHVRFAAEFDNKVKHWLSNVSRRSMPGTMTRTL